MIRLFVAIPLPDAVREALDELVEKHRGITWVPPSNRHLTLQFIGATPAEDVEKISAALDEIEIAQFFLPVEGVGKFPPRGTPKVLWAGVGRAHPHLFTLQRKVADALLPLGIEPDGRRYVPHITLARCGPRAGEFVRQFLKKHDQFQAPPFRVETFALYRSRTVAGAGAPVYEQISHHLLPPS